MTIRCYSTSPTISNGPHRVESLASLKRNPQTGWRGSANQPHPRLALITYCMLKGHPLI
ncbi:hypothetical protein DFAR_2210030 [Desulfarculales bacterium]